MNAQDSKASTLSSPPAVTDLHGNRLMSSDQILRGLGNILNGLDSLIYVSSMETDQILFVNNRLKEAFGLDDDAVGRLCWQVLQEPGAKRCTYCPADVLNKERQGPIVWEAYNTVTGRYYKNVDSAITWLDGKQVHLKGFVDITDLHDAQQEVRDVKERLEIALTASEAGVWDLDYATNQFTYDKLCGELIGLKNSPGTISMEALGDHFRRIMKGGVAPGLYDTLHGEDIFSGGTTVDSKLEFKNGNTRYIRSYGSVLTNQNGKPLRIVGMNMDITQDVQTENELKKAKEAMETQANMALAASQAKSQFLSNMSHEIRTPMNAIIGMSDLLANEPLSKRQTSYVNDIRISSTSLLGIINDILDFSKIEAGKMQLAPVDYDIIELLKNVGSMFSFTAQKKGISFDMDIQAALPPCLLGDDIRVRQILVNVLGNAVKFTNEGSVTFTVDVQDGMLCFDVADTGVGMREIDIPKIFNEFDQLDARVHRNITGTGLGLSITQKLVRMMGGSIQVDSVYGKGTVFHIQIPLVPGQQENLPAAKKEWRPIYAPKASILVVDDNEINLNVASGLLQLYGIECDTALSGAAAIRKTIAQKYDIVFMDHMMPEMDGIETTRYLRKQFSPDELVIVALTANAVEGVRETLLEAEMNDYLSKPIDKEQLNQLLEKWLPKDKILQDSRPPAHTKAAALSPLLCEVSNMDGIDVLLGLDRVGGLQGAYEQSLRILQRRIPLLIRRLQDSLSGGDMKAFSIEVHGLKGSLGNIGATTLAKTAETLEQRSKKNDMAYCNGLLPEFCAKLLRLDEQLGDALTKTAQPASKKAAGDRQRLPQQLALARILIDSFEGDAALKILNKLTACDYGNEANNALLDLTRLVEEFEFEKALEELDTRLGGDRHA